MNCQHTEEKIINEMSSPRSVGGSVREGTRVVLKEITATLHNSTQNHPPRHKNGGNDSPVSKTSEHEVKVRFAREFADVGSVAVSTPETLSSASSFHSLTSTLSTKSSSGICPDSSPSTLDDIANTSYVDANIPGVEDLILACADIHLENEQSCDNAADSSQDLSQDQTFASATDESPFHASDCSLNEDLRPDSVTGNETQVIETNSQLHETTYVSLNQTHVVGSPNNTVLIHDTQSVTPYPPAEENTPQVEETVDKPILSEKNDNTANELETSNAVSNTIKDSLPTSNVNNQLNVTTITSSDSSIPSVIDANKEQRTVKRNRNGDVIVLENVGLSSVEVSISAGSDVLLAQRAKDLSLIGISSLLLEATNSKVNENSAYDLSEPTRDTSSTVILSCNDTDQELFVSPPVAVNNSPVIQADKSDIAQIQQDNCVVSDIQENSTQLSDKTSITEPKLSEIQECSQRNEDARDLEIRNSAVLDETQTLLHKEDIAICNETRTLEEQDNPSETVIEEEEENTVKSASAGAVREKEASIEEDLDRTLILQELDEDFTNVPNEEQYSDFKPQRQSTTLSLIDKQSNFEEFKLEAEEITNNLLSSALDIAEETDFVSATSEIFEDPSTFDFLFARSNSRHTNRLRQESLYVKFDPLVSNTSMLPQGNAQPINEEQNGKSESPPPNVGTPKRNPAIAAIDRLLFYSPLPSGTVQKSEEAQEKNEQPVEEPKADAPLIADVNMVKELELVRTTVLQLEEELEKHKKEHEVELERQKTTSQEKINKLQTQMAQEVKTKTQMTVVVEEYEKSISRLLTERERDRTNFEQEKAKLQEELQAANHHLTNTEAAFNDVHQKYERLKGVVSVYKNNETVLKESIQENVETIKMLETRYDQLKDHAMAQLEKANLELDGIRKQNDAETVKLHAMIRKAELRSTSLSELVEQKTKENKELSKILDEVIARVGHGNQE